MLIQVEFFCVAFPTMVAVVPFNAFVGAFVVLMEVAFVAEGHVAPRECAIIRFFLGMAQNMWEKFAYTHYYFATLSIVIALK